MKKKKKNRFWCYAKRKEKDKYSIWAWWENLDDAKECIEYIRGLGYFAKLIDIKTNEVITSD